ncbi:putative quinol monooxygenase [Saccharothrix sp. HUAS TT1]|uniref:putative quinol monooxygenase n=1 Tax=unclassified Saccharothrix TaxID=2593673 RepID=UPI00345BC026
MLTKVLSIPLKPGKQSEAEQLVRRFALLGPEQEPATLSFRVYRNVTRPDYLLLVGNFADQDAYDAHTGSPAYRELMACGLAALAVEVVESDHEMIVSI